MDTLGIPLAWVPAMAWVHIASVPLEWVLGLMGTATARRLHVLLFPSSLEVPRKHDKRRSCHYKRGFP
jgi:hypothetical protein